MWRQLSSCRVDTHADAVVPHQIPAKLLAQPRNDASTLLQTNRPGADQRPVKRLRHLDIGC